MSPRRAGTRAGFTLVEVMLTLVIMAGIMVTITQVLTGVRKTRDEIHNIQERQLAGPAILQRIERDLRALYYFNRGGDSLLRIRDRVLDGFDADTLDFVTSEDGLLPLRERASDPFLQADVNEVGYRLRPRPDSDDFLEIYRREDFGVDDEPFDGGHFALLHDRVKSFDIEVFEEDGPEAEPSEDWGDEAYVGIPARIEIELTVEMAPRLVREQLVIERRTITYRRVFRFPENVRAAIGLGLVPVVPVPVPPPAEEGGLAAPTALEDEGDPNADPGDPDDPGLGGSNPFGGGEAASDDDPFLEFGGGG